MPAAATKAAQKSYYMRENIMSNSTAASSSSKFLYLETVQKKGSLKINNKYLKKYYPVINFLENLLLKIQSQIWWIMRRSQFHEKQ